MSAIKPPVEGAVLPVMHTIRPPLPGEVSPALRTLGEAMKADPAIRKALVTIDQTKLGSAAQILKQTFPLIRTGDMSQKPRFDTAVGTIAGEMDRSGITRSIWRYFPSVLQGMKFSTNEWFLGQEVPLVSQYGLTDADVRRVANQVDDGKAVLLAKQVNPDTLLEPMVAGASAGVTGVMVGLGVGDLKLLKQATEWYEYVFAFVSIAIGVGSLLL